MGTTACCVSAPSDSQTEAKGDEPLTLKGSGQAEAISDKTLETSKPGPADDVSPEAKTEIPENVTPEPVVAKQTPAKTAPAVPNLTFEQAKEALDKGIAAFTLPENLDKLKAVVTDCKSSSADETEQQMALVSKLLPLVQEVLGNELKSYGFDQASILMGVMQIKAHSAADPDMQTKVDKVMQILQGKFDVAELAQLSVDSNSNANVEKPADQIATEKADTNAGEVAPEDKTEKPDKPETSEETGAATAKAKAKTKTKSKAKAKAEADAKPKAEAAKPKKKAGFTEDQAKDFLDYAVRELEKRENMKELMTAIKDMKTKCKNDLEFQMESMSVLPPLIWRMLGKELSKYNYTQDNMMVAFLHLNGHAEKNKKLKSKLAKLMAYAEGKPPEV